MFFFRSKRVPTLIFEKALEKYPWLTNIRERSAACEDWADIVVTVETVTFHFAKFALFPRGKHVCEGAWVVSTLGETQSVRPLNLKGVYHRLTDRLVEALPNSETSYIHCLVISYGSRLPIRIIQITAGGFIPAREHTLLGDDHPFSTYANWHEARRSR